MTSMVFQLVGGIGLFLMGMVLLTDGLKAFAGESLRVALVRFTGTPLKAFGSGALATALVQSSSATTVTVIGFVSAGLLTFPQAVGVVIGASLGTTGTGWIVSVLGLKISVGFYALPLVGIGAFLKLLARGRGRALGLALAGFGLIFVGIETLQTGMQAASGRFRLSELPGGGLFGHLLAMGLGVILTVIMQSSSAAVATTLTALHSGTVNFDQAASIVIGAAVGTTVTGALAAIGGSVSAKRTAIAHVLFNLATGLVAVVSLPLFLRGIRWAQDHLGLDPGATSLAAFHTGFIAVGVLIFLPWVHRFSAWIERLLPERGPILTRHLDDTVLHAPAVALEATRRALCESAATVFRTLRDGLQGPAAGRDDPTRREVERALERIQEFFTRIPPIVEDAPLSRFRLAQVHAVDHLVRLIARWEVPPGLRHRQAQDRFRPALTLCQDILDTAERGLIGGGATDWLARVEGDALALAQLRRQERPVVLSETAGGQWGASAALEILDAIRWFDRVGYHTWRIANYLGGDGQPEPPGAVAQEDKTLAALPPDPRTP
ncbi:MAG: Na/Pi cotransporter family protein [Verrucomicrobiae bacterium]|nr:Na/Pi cotransporter family protein [Verrucomicrobiae bacterium]